MFAQLVTSSTCGSRFFPHPVPCPLPLVPLTGNANDDPVTETDPIELFSGDSNCSSAAWSLNHSIPDPPKPVVPLLMKFGPLGAGVPASEVDPSNSESSQLRSRSDGRLRGEKVKEEVKGL
jgi:hypothetical protein